MIPPIPLAHPHIDKLAGLTEPANAAGGEEIERRAEELLNEWLKIFFRGVAFETPLSGGGVQSRTFEKCDLLWGMDSPPFPAPLPLLHLILADRRDGQPIQTGEHVWQCNGRWTWNALVRSSAQMPVDSIVPRAPGDDLARAQAQKINRRAADQLRWLLLSPHAVALAVKGIGRINVESGPSIVPAGAWIMRQLTFSAEITYRFRSNEP